MSDNTAAPWLMLLNELQNLLSLGHPDDPKYAGLQILPEPAEALWDDQVHGNFIVWQLWADTMPKWGATYFPNANNFFSVAYGIEFLLSLSIQEPDSSLKQAIDNDSQALAQAAKDLLNLRLQSGRDWKDFNQQQQDDLPPDQWLTYDQWYQQSGYPDQVAAKEEERLTLLGQFAADVERAVNPDSALVGMAIQAWNNETNFWKGVTDLDGATETIPAWEVSPDLGTWLQEAAAGQGQSIDLTINKNTSTSVNSSYGVDGAVGISVGFIGVSVGGGYTHQTIDTTSTAFSMGLKSNAFGSFLLSPSGWYSGNVVERFKDGPFKPGNSAAEFFGATGIMNLLPATLYVIFQPTITLQLTQSDYNQVKNGWNAGGGIMIGPFSFGGKGSGQNDTINTDDTTCTLTLASKSPHPLVMAVLNNVLP